MEQDRRHRHWVLLREAKRLLSDAEVGEFATALSRREMARDQPMAQRIDA
jgi:hypothetical protein